MQDGAAGHIGGEQVFTTTDLPLMAYYLLNGIELVKVSRRNDGNRDFVFHYRDKDGTAEQLRVDWLNSRFAKYDNAVRGLKKLCQEMRHGKRRGGRNARR